jgi:putative two-component system response regulator
MTVAGNAAPRAHRVLIVDDEEGTRGTLARLMRRCGHEVEVACDGFEGLAKLELDPDLVLLDVNMPAMDGFAVVEQIRRDPRRQHLPIMMVSGLDETRNWRRALAVGASDFIGKPIEPAELELRSAWLLRMKEATDELDRHRGRLTGLVEARTVALREALDQMAAAQRRTHEAHLDTVRRLVVAAEYRDRDTAAHIERIGRYAAMLAEGLGLRPGDVELLRQASPMHDVGKIGIPDAILLKPGPLTEDERRVMRQHPLIGARILEGSPSEIVQAGSVIALAHHERWDGAGYPFGTAGTAIPLFARICAVADVFDALTTVRPYREPLSIETALAIMEIERGRHFDPQILDVLLERRSELAAILEDLAAPAGRPAAKEVA